MTRHSEELWSLAAELLDSVHFDDLRVLANTQPIGLRGLARLDRRIGGPSISTINRDGTGQYDVDDRDVFRPLQYCVMYFRNGLRSGDLEWFARNIVEMSCLHIEGLVKRVGGPIYLPLGSLLRHAVVKRRLDPATWERIHRFVKVFNDAKHNLSHEKDTHFFSVSDAVVAYIVCRRLGLSLYHLAGLSTNLAVFDEAFE